jgi:hypothetical protein
MSVDNATDKQKAAGADPAAAEKDAEARKAAADSLRNQIANLKAGRKPRSLNEFIEEKMAEDRRKQKEKDEAGH